MPSRMTISRPVWLSLVLMVATVIAGMAVRFVPLGLPKPVVKYGGSMFWALMIYWVLTTVLPSLKAIPAVVLCCLSATAVEFFKLYHSPALDHFRTTIPGILLLGRYFSVWDIVAYWSAIVIGAVIDFRLLRTRLAR